MAQTYISNIRQVISQRLKTANKSIDVAMAWFTDPNLLAILEERQSKGILVRILLSDQPQNKKLDFSTLVSLGGRVVIATASSGLMHIKLCIIDHRLTIMGSYNWTLTASRHNVELITISEDHDNTMVNVNIFEELWLQFDRSSTSFLSDGQFVLRLGLLRQIILQDDQDELSYQMTKIRLDNNQLSANARALFDSLVIAIDKRHYHQAIEIIDHYCNQQKTISIYQDPEIDRLKLEISWVRLAMIQLQEQVHENQDLINNWEKKLLAGASDLLTNLYALRTELAKLKHQASQKAESGFAYEEAKQKQQHFWENKDALNSLADLSDEELKQLKALFKEASLLCHPDKADQSDPVAVKQAHENQVLINEAYAEQNIQKLKQVLANIKAMQTNVQTQLTSAERIMKLQQQLLYFREQYQITTDQILAQQQSESYINATNCTDWEAWLANFRTTISAEILDLERQISIYARYKVN